MRDQGGFCSIGVIENGEVVKEVIFDPYDKSRRCITYKRRNNDTNRDKIVDNEKRDR